MKPIERLLYRLELIESRVNRIQQDLKCVQASNEKLHQEKKDLEDIIIIMKAENSKEEEIEEESGGWFW